MASISSFDRPDCAKLVTSRPRRVGRMCAREVIPSFLRCIAKSWKLGRSWHEATFVMGAIRYNVTILVPRAAILISCSCALHGIHDTFSRIEGIGIAQGNTRNGPPSTPNSISRSRYGAFGRGDESRLLGSLINCDLLSFLPFFLFLLFLGANQ
ncbi:hypothetical protein M426DRAFT_157939 [Hypoxylon sp. CI-4A]|nr:hypothetical protein M426DRAFT_157939 [Hypoxylon sp. CI-4A]